MPEKGSLSQLSLETDKSVLARYLALEQPEDRVQCMYIWIDGTGQGLRAKTRTMTFIPIKPSDLPIWNFDGSSTGQASGHNSDVYLYPVALYNDPFRGNNNKLVLCETYNYDKTPNITNHRVKAIETAKKCEKDEPWFGIEQEYTLFDVDGHPLGWPKNGYPGPQGIYHTGVGLQHAFGRDILEAHYRVCMAAGINIYGSNAEAMPSQWEYQIGPNDPIKMSDDLWMSRFLLHRVAEDFGVVANIEPKPIKGNWSGSGAHTNFSTKAMRDAGGLKYIHEAIDKLHVNHDVLLTNYDPSGGEENMHRLTGTHETARHDTFVSGVANRIASVRIPRHVYDAAAGYLEDRRPGANCDPYVVTDSLLRVLCLNEKLTAN